MPRTTGESKRRRSTLTQAFDAEPESPGQQRVRPAPRQLPSSPMSEATAHLHDREVQADRRERAAAIRERDGTEDEGPPAAPRPSYPPESPPPDAGATEDDDDGGDDRADDEDYHPEEQEQDEEDEEDEDEEEQEEQDEEDEEDEDEEEEEAASSVASPEVLLWETPMGVWGPQAPSSGSLPPAFEQHVPRARGRRRRLAAPPVAPPLPCPEPPSR